MVCNIVLVMIRMRGAILAAALTGCTATAQLPEWQPPKTTEKTSKAKPQPCKNQECLVEKARKDCQEDRKCVQEKVIKRFEFPGKEENYSITVKEGDEVFSLILGNDDYALLVSVDVKKIDENGVAFNYNQKETRGFLGVKPVETAEFRVNFDGNTDGDIWKLEPLEIWNLKVEKANGGVTVSFSTADSRINAYGYTELKRTTAARMNSAEGAVQADSKSQ